MIRAGLISDPDLDFCLKRLQRIANVIVMLEVRQSPENAHLIDEAQRAIADVSGFIHRSTLTSSCHSCSGYHAPGNPLSLPKGTIPTVTGKPYACPLCKGSAKLPVKGICAACGKPETRELQPMRRVADDFASTVLVCRACFVNPATFVNSVPNGDQKET